MSSVSLAEQEKVMRTPSLDNRTSAQRHHSPPPPRSEEVRPQPRRSRDTEFTRDILLLAFVLLALAGGVAVAVRVPALPAFLYALLPGA